MSTERWLRVEERVLLAIANLDGRDDEEVISYDGASWQRGVKVVGCSNRRSLDFLTGVVEGCGELWEGAKLEVIPRSSLPLRKIASVWIPPPVLEDGVTLRIIKQMNRSLNTQDWKVISLVQSKNGNGKDIVFSIDEQSLQELKRRQGSVKFGLGTLKFRIPNEPKNQPPGEVLGGAGQPAPQ